MPDRGDGACVYLKDNLCSIYDTRPELCNMEKMWVKRNRELDLEVRGITKKDYFKLNNEVCNQMIKEDELDEKYLINLEEYDKMGEKISQNEKDTAKNIENTATKQQDTAKKPKISEFCGYCESPLVITSIVPQNHQINIMCSSEKCMGIGFIHMGEIFMGLLSDKTGQK